MIGRPVDRQLIERRRPAQLMLVGSSAASFPTALRHLTVFRPVLTHTGELRAGPLILHVWIVRLGIYYRPPARTG